MGFRSEVQVVRHPWPVVFEAFVHTLPTRGVRIRRTDPAQGRIWCRTRRHTITISVGAVDAITTEWVADLELRIGLGPDRSEDEVGRIAHALDDYLAAYYGSRHQG